MAPLGFDVVFPVWCLTLIGIALFVGSHTERRSKTK